MRIKTKNLEKNFAKKITILEIIWGMDGIGFTFIIYYHTLHGLTEFSLR